MALIGAKVVVAQLVDQQGVVVGLEKDNQLAELGLICADRVRAAVRFELKPAKIFGRGGLQIVWHVEADCMLP